MTWEDEAGALVREALSVAPGGFRPCAWFDAPLDCIRIIVRDCSYSEIRINQFLTLLEENYPATQDEPEYVGFTLKGVKHLCKTHGIPLDAPVKLADIFDLVLSESEPHVRPTYFKVVRPMVTKSQAQEFDLAA